MGNARFWVGVVSADHVGTAANRGICAFSHGREAAVAKLGPGHGFACYTPGTGIGEGEVVQVFTANGHVTGDAPFQVNRTGTEFAAWVRSAEYAGDARIAIAMGVSAEWPD